MSNLEQKYQKQLKELNNNHSRIVNELINSKKGLENEIKALRSENQNKKQKTTNDNEYNKKLEEINLEKEKYQKLEEALKLEKDKQIQDLTANFTKEKENLKNKIADIEKNLREAEGKRGVLLLELEKEKAKWDIEKDNLQTKCQEYNDRIITLEKKNENLLRDNEKLKNEKYQLRTRGYKANDYKLGSHFGTTVGTKKFDYASSYNNAMISALDKNNKEDSKEKEKEVSEKPSKVTPTSNNKTTTVNTGNKTIGTGNATKTVNERKEMTRKNK